MVVLDSGNRNNARKFIKGIARLKMIAIFVSVCLTTNCRFYLQEADNQAETQKSVGAFRTAKALANQLQGLFYMPNGQHIAQFV